MYNSFTVDYYEVINTFINISVIPIASWQKIYSLFAYSKNHRGCVVTKWNHKRWYFIQRTT